MKAGGVTTAKRWLVAAVLAGVIWLTAALERFEREFPCDKS